MTVLDKDHQSACAEKALQQTNKNHSLNKFAHFSPAHTVRASFCTLLVRSYSTVARPSTTVHKSFRNTGTGAKVFGLKKMDFQSFVEKIRSQNVFEKKSN